MLLVDRFDEKFAYQTTEQQRSHDAKRDVVDQVVSNTMIDLELAQSCNELTSRVVYGQLDSVRLQAASSAEPVDRFAPVRRP